MSKKLNIRNNGRFGPKLVDGMHEVMSIIHGDLEQAYRESMGKSHKLTPFELAQASWDHIRDMETRRMLDEAFGPRYENYDRVMVETTKVAIEIIGKSERCRKMLPRIIEHMQLNMVDRAKKALRSVGATRHDKIEILAYCEMQEDSLKNAPAGYAYPTYTIIADAIRKVEDDE